MEKLEFLLTDEFVAYSQKIAKIVDTRKAKKQELKAFYDSIMTDLKALDDEALAATKDFEAFKAGEKCCHPETDCREVHAEVLADEPKVKK